jgi:hypothetical protein
MNDAFERLARINPVPHQLAAPPVDTMLAQVDSHGAHATSEARSVIAEPRQHRAATAIAALASILVVAAIAMGAVLLLGRHAPSGGETASNSQGAAELRQIINEFGVLRRPRTRADVDRSLLAQIRRRQSDLTPTGDPDVTLMRRIVARWGAPFYLVPFTPPSASSLHKVWSRMNPHDRRSFSAFSASHEHETLAVYASDGGGGGDGSLSHIKSIGWSSFRGGRLAGSDKPRTGTVELVRVVPDGVRTVKFVGWGRVGRPAPGTPRHLPDLRATAVVHDNLAAVRVSRPQPPGHLRVTWYDANGHVVRPTAQP